jgi:hypothetical protein
MRTRLPSCVAVLSSNLFDVAGVRPPANHIQQPKAAVPVAAELDADRPIGVVELGLFGRREIPIADNVEVRRDRVDESSAT